MQLYTDALLPWGFDETKIIHAAQTVIIQVAE